MPTPACLATAVIGAPGSATNTARADSRMRWSLRAASAWRPLIGPLRPALCRPALGRPALCRPALCRPALGRPGLPAGGALVSVMKKSVAGTGTNHSVLIVLEQKISFRHNEIGARDGRDRRDTGGSDVVSSRDQEHEPRGHEPG